jgi:hypothetical protein
MWPMTRWIERQARLFGDMMQRAGADTGTTVREQLDGGFVAACRRCLACSASIDCRRWLESGGADAPPTFCPNAAFLNQVRAPRGTGLPTAGTGGSEGAGFQ